MSYDIQRFGTVPFHQAPALNRHLENCANAIGQAYGPTRFLNPLYLLYKRAIMGDIARQLVALHPFNTTNKGSIDSLTTQHVKYGGPLVRPVGIKVTSTFNNEFTRATDPNGQLRPHIKSTYSGCESSHWVPER